MTTAAQVAFVEDWETDTPGSVPGAPWFIDPHMADGGLSVAAGSDFGRPPSNQGLIVNGAGFNGKNAGIQAMLIAGGMQAQATDTDKIVVQYYAKGAISKRSEWYFELSQGDVHAPRLADIGVENPLPNAIPVIAYCKPVLEPPLEHKAFYFFDGRMWKLFGALDLNLFWQTVYFRVSAQSLYLDCGCNNTPVDVPRQYFGTFDRVSIYTLDGLYSDYTAIDEIRITGGIVSPMLNVSPAGGFTSIGPVGGSFTPSCQTYTLTNTSLTPMNWSAGKSQTWLDVSPTSGLLAPGATVDVNVCVNGNANTLTLNRYTDQVIFTDVTNGLSQNRKAELCVGQVDDLTELFTGNNDLDHTSVMLTPDASPHAYQACSTPATQFPTAPGGILLSLTDNNFTKITLQQGAQVQLYGTAYPEFYVGANGYVTFDAGDTLAAGTLQNHFSKRRISGLFTDLAPVPDQITVKQIMDRVAITWQNVSAGAPGTDSFQMELFFDGRIRLSWLNIASTDGVVGLSKGEGIPANFHSSDFTAYAACLPGRHPADFDADTDVDQSDFGHLQACLGTRFTQAPYFMCPDSDLNLDGYVDAADMLLFAECLNGPNLPPVADCITIGP